MSSENNGSQQIIWKYYTPLESAYLFSELSGITRPGLVTLPNFTLFDGSNDTVVISPFSCFVRDFGANSEAFFKVSTTSDATLYLPSDTKFIGLQYTYEQEIYWFADFVALSSIPTDYKGIILCAVTWKDGVAQFSPAIADFSDIYYKQNEIPEEFHLRAATPRDTESWSNSLIVWDNLSALSYSKNTTFSEFAEKVTGENAIIDIASLTEDTLIGVVLDENDHPKIVPCSSGNCFFYTIGKITLKEGATPGALTSSDVEYESYFPQPLNFVSRTNYYGVATPGLFTVPEVTINDNNTITIGAFTAFVFNSTDASRSTVHKVYTAPVTLELASAPIITLTYNGTDFIWENVSFVAEDFVGIIVTCIGLNNGVPFRTYNCHDYSSAYYKANYKYSEFIIEPATPRGLTNWGPGLMKWVKTIDLSYLNGTVVIDTTNLDPYIYVGGFTEAVYLGLYFNFTLGTVTLQLAASATNLTFLLGKLTPPSVTPEGGLTASDLTILTYFPREPQNVQMIGDLPDVLKVKSVNTEAIWNINDLNISTQEQEVMRQEYLDQGNKYLDGETGEIYHFDVDRLNQHKKSNITIDGETVLVGASDSTATHDFTPFLLPFAPFFLEGKSLSGKASITYQYEAVEKFCFSFWVKFFELENATIFDFGSIALADRIRFLQLRAQPAFTDINEKPAAFGVPGVDGVPFTVGQDPVTYVEHSDSSKTETVDLPSIRAGFWYHIMLTVSADRKVIIRLAYLDTSLKTPAWHFDSVTFDLFNSLLHAYPVILNASKSDFLTDELYFDVVEFDETTFRKYTENRYPWAAIQKDENSLILATYPEKFHTNLFGKTGLFVQTMFDFIIPLGFKYVQETSGDKTPEELWPLVESTWSNNNNTSEYPMTWVRTA